MSSAKVFDELFYLENNGDVSSAVESGEFDSAFNHFIVFGGLELRAPNSIFDPAYYIQQNPVVQEAALAGHFRNVFEHYQLFGERENRAPGLDFEGFNPTLYLAENPDVRAAVDQDHFISALDHYISFGIGENRSGTGITVPEIAFELTRGKDNFKGTEGDDIFFGMASFLSELDKIDGRGGIDTLELISTELVTLPDMSNLQNIEQLTIRDTEHQTLDFSGLAQISKIELKSGITKNTHTITATLGDHQALALTSIKDGDTKSSSLSHGGIKIDQNDTVSHLDLSLSDVGMTSGQNFRQVVVDLAGKGVSSLNIANEKTSAIRFENSGGSLLTINLEANADIDLGLIPKPVAAINASSSQGNIRLIQEGDTTSRTGAGNDNISVLAGTNNIFSAEGHDRIIATGGNNGINTGSGNDRVILSGGTNTLVTGINNDTISVSGGNNDLNTGLGNDTVTLNGGINTATTGSGNDRAFIRGGQQTLNLGAGQDTVDIIGGTNSVNTGSGNDTVSIKEGFNVVSRVSDIDLGEGDDNLAVTCSINLSNYKIAGGPGTDSISVTHNGPISFPGEGNVSGFENIFVSNSTHQSIDFSGFTSVENITLSSGTTIDGATVTTTLGANQKLTLEDITDGDVGAAALSDGGLTIAQSASITSLDLKLADVGPNSAAVNENLFIDIAGQGIATVNLESEDTNFVSLSNSGGLLSILNVIGSGPLGLILNTPGTINATSFLASLTLTGSSSGNTITAASGNDTITLSGGTNIVDSGSGDDSITLSTGSDTVNSGSGNDVVVASSGTNIIQTEDGDDQITLSGG
tara:strand:+ start:609 stop:3038 length:2430 start_codon:yes stop_codon:yes gene_type:complete